MSSSCSAGSLPHERTQNIAVISCVQANLETAVTGRNKAKQEEFFTGNRRLILCLVSEHNSVEKKEKAFKCNNLVITYPE